MRSVRQRHLRGAWRAAAALFMATLMLAPLSALAASRSATVTVGAAAWYAPPPTCALPTGCGPTAGLPANSMYPAGTLHIGVAAGIEAARTYLSLVVPANYLRAATAGMLTIPIAGSDAGTSNPDLADVQACLAADPFPRASGSQAPPPAIDCSVSAGARYHGGAHPALTLNLLVFLSAWRGAYTNNGIALVPTPGEQPTTSWHLAFRAPGDEYRASSPISGTVTYDGASSTQTAVPPSAAPASAAGPPASPPLNDLPTAPSNTVAAPQPASPPEVALPDQPAPVAFTPDGGFAYPVVYLLPLALLAMAALLYRAFAQPLSALTPAPRRTAALDQLLRDVAARSHPG